MEFFKELLLSLLSGLAAIFVPKKKERSGIVVSRNKNTELKNIKASGRVEITNNESLVMDAGEFHG